MFANADDSAEQSPTLSIKPQRQRNSQLEHRQRESRSKPITQSKRPIQSATGKNLLSTKRTGEHSECGTKLLTRSRFYQVQTNAQLSCEQRCHRPKPFRLNH